MVKGEIGFLFLYYYFYQDVVVNVSCLIHASFAQYQLETELSKQ